MEGVTKMHTGPTFTHNLPSLQKGFTLAELMITLTIGTVLTTMAVPAFSTMLEENRMLTHIYELIGHINYTRSTAVTSARQVVICKSADGSSCDSDAEWDDGWIIFIDTSPNLQRDSDEPLLRVKRSPDDGGSIDFGAFGSENYLAFQPTGMLKKGNGTFTFCSRNNEVAPRAVIISKPGRIRISREKPDGTSLTCPD
jgi:type IV fimbrial biogenesis protein FimT